MGKWAKSGCRTLFPGKFPGKLDAAANGVGNPPGNAAGAHPISRLPIPREIPLGIPREIGCAAAAFPGKFPRPLAAASNFPKNFPGNRERQPDFAHFPHSDIAAPPKNLLP